MFELTIGFIGATLTTVSFIPQAIRVIKTKSTADISLGMFLAMSVGIVCWLIYGILRNDVVVISANVVSVVFSGIILGYKIRYK